MHHLESNSSLQNGGPVYPSVSKESSRCLRKVTRIRSTYELSAADGYTKGRQLDGRHLDGRN